MANYMADVAKLIGVELGEEFCIKGYSKIYTLDEDGLFDKQDGLNNFMHLTCLLTGEFEIVRKPWKPKEDELFFVISFDGSIMIKYWDDESTIYRTYYKLGNCYRYKDEAEANRDKWIRFYASDAVLEV